MTANPHAGQPVVHRGAELPEAGAAVILLHGRGASPEDILGLSDEMDLPGIAWLAPAAAGRTWYPNSFLVPTATNEPYLASALQAIAATLHQAIAAGIPHERIALCGFSQGACLATEFVARNPERYGGLIALTGGLIGTDREVTREALRPTATLAGTPVFFGSGDPDPHVPWQRVEQSAAILADMGAQVTTRRYPGRPHTVTRDELDHAAAILTAMLPRGQRQAQSQGT